MQAITLDLNNPNGISLSEIDLLPLKPAEVRVKIIAAALNHRDEWCRLGKYANIQNGIILGSDGAGLVEAVGEKVDQSWLGKAVIINAANHWGDDQRVQSKDFQIFPPIFRSLVRLSPRPTMRSFWLTRSRKTFNRARWRNSSWRATQSETRWMMWLFSAVPRAFKNKDGVCNRWGLNRGR